VREENLVSVYHSSFDVRGDFCSGAMYVKRPGPVFNCLVVKLGDMDNLYHLV
jgi:hypothetical protein